MGEPTSRSVIQARKAKRHPRSGIEKTWTAKYQREMFSRRIPKSFPVAAKRRFAVLLQQLDSVAYHRDRLGEKVDEVAGYCRENAAALRDLLAFYDRVAGTEGKGGKSGESWSTAEVRRLAEIRALVGENDGR
jgi:hypothetical protein